MKQVGLDDMTTITEADEEQFPAGRRTLGIRRNLASSHYVRLRLAAA